MRPAAGIMGLIYHPIHGAYKSAQSSLGPLSLLATSQQIQAQRSIHGTRVRQGKEEVRKSTKEQRDEVVRVFRELSQKEKVEERRKELQKRAEEVLKEVAKAKAAEEEEQRKQKVDDDEVEVVDKTAPGSGESAPVLGAVPTEEARTEEDLQFERDLEIAKQLSLAEQSGYERGLAQGLDGRFEE
jgi:sterol 3beta-glucosyltransferase